MMNTKKTFLVAVPAAALVLGGGIGIGLAAASGQSQTAPRPASQQVLVTTHKTGTLTAQRIPAKHPVKHTAGHGQPAKTTPARTRDRDCDRTGRSTATPKATVAAHRSGTTQRRGSTHRSGTTYRSGSTYHGGWTQPGGEGRGDCGW